MAKVDPKTFEAVVNIVKSPADAVAIIKSSNGEVSIRGQVITITY